MSKNDIQNSVIDVEYWQHEEMATRSLGEKV